MPAASSPSGFLAGEDLGEESVDQLGRQKRRRRVPRKQLDDVEADDVAAARHRCQQAR